jgi:ribosomal protein L11 methyltransferase
VLEIDPKSSFGTGQHETTSLCLKILEANIKGDESVLDMGCGSGILAIASLLLGARKALCVDIDENCIITTKENAELNGVLDKIEALSGNALQGPLRIRVTGEKYDVICANIVADVIISFLGLFEKVLKKGGMLMLSGIIDTRLSDVTDALKKYNFKTEEIIKQNGWCAIRLSI